MPQTAAENAEVLAALAGGHDASSELFLYFTKLHIQARTRNTSHCTPQMFSACLPMACRCWDATYVV